MSQDVNLSSANDVAGEQRHTSAGLIEVNRDPLQLKVILSCIRALCIYSVFIADHLRSQMTSLCLQGCSFQGEKLSRPRCHERQHAAALLLPIEQARRAMGKRMSELHAPPKIWIRFDCHTARLGPAPQRKTRGITMHTTPDDRPTD